MSLAKEIMGGGISPGAALSIGGGAGTLAATGSAQGDAALILTTCTLVTAADGTKGVILPAMNIGESCEMFNNAGSTLKVYPPTGSAICVNGTGLGSANAAFSQLTYKHTRYSCYSSTQIMAITSA